MAAAAQLIAPNGRWLSADVPVAGLLGTSGDDEHDKEQQPRPVELPFSATPLKLFYHTTYNHVCADMSANKGAKFTVYW
jgi:hypothetical protein